MNFTYKKILYIQSIRRKKKMNQSKWNIENEVVNTALPGETKVSN
jgi:hypothetical protein